MRCLVMLVVGVVLVGLDDFVGMMYPTSHNRCAAYVLAVTLLIRLMS